jgi:hypothetical protein
MLDTCKSTFAVAMVRFPGYDVDVSCTASEDLRALLLHTTYGRSSSSRTWTGTCRVLTFMTFMAELAACHTPRHSHAVHF